MKPSHCRPSGPNLTAVVGPNQNAKINPPLASERTALEGQVESLQRDIQQLQLEYDLLKKANELLKKDLGIDLHLLTNREKTLLVDALRQTYPLSQLLGALGLARSSYFHHRARLQIAEKYAGLRSAITEI
jgi:hypothetical protein